MRSLVPVLAGLTVVGLVLLALQPVAALVGGGAGLVIGLVVRARRDRVAGTAFAATGIGLALAAVLMLVLVSRDQDTPVRLGPGSGLVPDASTSP